MSEQKPASIWELLNDVTSDKKGLFYQDEQNQKTYNPYIFNLMLSYQPDCILIVNELNKRSSLSKRWHHDYLFQKLPKRKRFAKLAKPEESEKIELLMEVFEVNHDRAKEMMFAFNDDDYEEMKKSRYSGGVVKSSNARK